ncbi:hypothetical protein P691DRAFT_767537 [Macrolepiota fuliginosa MF-IS2]|uniref:Uncharacterized protein n=1 Tax=Macrolepiota fuliginosa MF-IS2 TaxID=1400762 RepID=A0A9P6BWC0_9AGAR|nr:hypothetical protein P691DRAFT_767537 [Macrolepiota fuliginosa MF-IS2]
MTPPPPLFVTTLEFARTVKQAMLQNSSHVVIEELDIIEEDGKPITPPAIVVFIEERDVIEAPELPSIEDNQLQEHAIHDSIVNAEADHANEPSVVDQGNNAANEQVNQVAEPPSANWADDMTPWDEFHPRSCFYQQCLHH